jgi:hypothetical protein
MESLRLTIASKLQSVLGCALVVYGAIACIQVEAQTPLKKVANTKIDFAKQYVFAGCVAQAYPNTPLADEASMWAAGVVELSNLSPKALKALSELAKKAPPALVSKPDEVSLKSTPMLMENCFNWHNSIAVNAAIQKLLRQAQ